MLVGQLLILAAQVCSPFARASELFTGRGVGVTQIHFFTITVDNVRVARSARTRALRTSDAPSPTDTPTQLSSIEMTSTARTPSPSLNGDVIREEPGTGAKRASSSPDRKSPPA
jgi:hypothetical protein